MFIFPLTSRAFILVAFVITQKPGVVVFTLPPEHSAPAGQGLHSVFFVSAFAFEIKPGLHTQPRPSTVGMWSLSHCAHCSEPAAAKLPAAHCKHDRLLAGA